METSRLIEMGVGLVLFVYVISALVPNALSSILAVNGSSSSSYAFWGSSVMSLWGILGIFIIIAIVMMVYGFVKQV
jgi:hypothetical protein